jgi:hypothetical protein
MAGTYRSYTPAFSGFSTDPIVNAQYYARGKMVHVVITTTTDGTSNATVADSFKFTLPFPASSLQGQSMTVAQITNNGSKELTNIGFVLTSAGSNVATCYRNPSATQVWDGSNGKSFSGSFVYEAEDTDAFESTDSTGVARPAIIAWGQSNLGTGVTTVASDLELAYQVPFPEVRFYQHSASMNTAVVTMDHTDNTSYQTPDQNATYSLQFYLYPQVAAEVARNLYVVHHGEGNTGLAVEWKPSLTIGDNYRELLFKTKALNNKILDQDGIAPSWKFMLIVHGEYDSRVEAYANDYETNLTNFITNFRTQSGLTSLPVIIMRLNTEMITAPVNPGTYGATIQTAQDNVATNMTDVYIYDPDGATMNADKIHYTVAGEHTVADGILNVATTNGLI